MPIRLRTTRSDAESPPQLELLTIREAAGYAKISSQTVRRWLKNEGLKSYRAGRQIRINRKDLDDFLAA